MPVSTIECPECQKVLRTSTELTPGKKIRCPKCQAVFPVPEEEERPRSAIRSKNGANGSARKRPVDDDEEGFEDRRGRRNGSTAGMGARKRSRDDDDDYDRDMDDEDERPRRKKKAKSGGLMLGLIIGGAAFLLLGGFALTAFVWPGFLRSSGASAPGGGQDPFAFMPARSDIVMGVNADAMFKVPGFRQGFEQGVQMGNPLPPGAIELVRNADRVVIGVDSSSESVVVAILTKNAVEADKIRQTFQAGPAKTIQGKTCYPLQHGEGYVTLPNSRLILVCKMPDNELGALLNSDGKTNRLNPDMQNQVRAHENSLLYFLVGMSPKLQQSIKGAALFIPPGKGGKQNDLAALLPLLERCKSVTASMDLINKDVQFKASLSCATDADASQCRNSLEKAWNEQGKPAVQKEGKAFTGLTDDLIKTLKFQTQGPMVNVSLQISENTLKELEKLGGPPGMPPGGFQPGGFQGGKGFQGGMPGNFQGGMPGNFQGGIPGNFQGGKGVQGGVPGNFQGGIPGNFQGGKGVQGGVPGNFQSGIPGNFQGGKGPPGNFQGGIPGNFQGGAPDPSGKK